MTSFRRGRLSAIHDGRAVNPVFESGSRGGCAGDERGKLVAVNRVAREYRNRERITRATQPASFDVYGADRFVLLRSSGCGKSTVAQGDRGFRRAVEGAITLAGDPVRGPGTDRIAVFQAFDRLPSWMTVLGNVAFALSALAVTTRVGRDLLTMLTAMFNPLRSIAWR